MEDSFFTREREHTSKTLLRIIGLWTIIALFMWAFSYVNDIGWIFQVIFFCSGVVSSGRIWRVYHRQEDIWNENG